MLTAAAAIEDYNDDDGYIDLLLSSPSLSLVSFPEEFSFAVSDEFSITTAAATTVPADKASATTEDHHHASRASPVPAKRVRYDKLGREIAAPDDSLLLLPNKKPASYASAPVLKRPRGRTPKGMIWDDKRGYVPDCMRAFKLH